MNILWISLYPPLPLNFGGPVGIYKRLVELRKYNDIYLFYINENNDELYDVELSKLCKQVHSYHRNSIRSIDSIINLVRYPYTAATRFSKKMRDDICACIENQKIDLINVEFPQMCINLKGIKERYGIPIVMHEHNNEWNRFLQMSKTVSGVKALLYRRESRLLYRMERELVNKSMINHYTFLSDKDCENFAKEFSVNKERLSLVPLGADNTPLPQDSHLGKNIIFCAAMDSELNQEAVKWFINNVFPRICEQVSNVTFYIVGREPSDDIKNMASDNIVVTGTVADLKEYYKMADVVVIPLLHGGGVKVKLLEAVGFDRNIVTTSVGIEGTSFDPNDQILVSDEAEEFASNCIRILIDKEYANFLRMNTRKHYLDNYTWESIGEKYNLLMKRIKEQKEL